MDGTTPVSFVNLTPVLTSSTPFHSVLHGQTQLLARLFEAISSCTISSRCIVEDAAVATLNHGICSKVASGTLDTIFNHCVPSLSVDATT